MEEWKSLSYNGKKYSKYEISSFGRLRKTTTKELCKLNHQTNGYVGYNKPLENGEDKRIYLKIHRAVLCSFDPDSDYTKEVNHIDGNKQNNHLDNLEWVTHRENMLHARRKGLLKRSGAPRKLSNTDVKYVRENPDNLSIYRLAKIFQVDKKTMKNIYNAKTYKDIE